jgi:hypothetical protein
LGIDSDAQEMRGYKTPFLMTTRTGWISRSETQAVIRRGFQCVFSEGSDILLVGVEKRLHKLFGETVSPFQIAWNRLSSLPEVGTVKKDVTVQATAVYDHG